MKIDRLCTKVMESSADNSDESTNQLEVAPDTDEG